MKELTTHERVTLMYEHKEADRVPVTDIPWGSTLERWRREGMPEGVGPADFFGLDRFVGIGVDNSPRFPEEVIEETDEYIVQTTRWGATVKDWKHRGGVPLDLDFRIKDREGWTEAKGRMTPTRDRVDWDNLKANWNDWRESGAWITGGFWFGFDVVHARVLGTEETLLAMALQPDWIKDIVETQLDMDIALFDMIWEEGYHFDEMMWWDDMGYKGTQFFSLGMYRDILKPAHRRACDWAHAKGLRVRLHSCGNISAFIPDLIEIGVEMLNPIEVKAGLDPVALKGEFGDRLGFQGGLNAVLYTQPEKLWAEMRRVVPAMKKNGGYIVSSDHSVPETVSLEDFRRFVSLAKELGAYV
ncbi:MAG: uroporphyrinogen decarboxylase family protein [Planctomycetota bacterium]